MPPDPQKVLEEQRFIADLNKRGSGYVVYVSSEGEKRRMRRYLRQLVKRGQLQYEGRVQVRDGLPMGKFKVGDD